ncbi:hypothetical protein CRG98_012213 [Punica granatum]|uniref:Uncharacterized protein n=1 Tax=Punica granatum TaxID=22663 RepID=A0A2I0KHV6_PUNGR|nr:hypothetical protein CRG98_012213 [Punica granatum]
MKEHELFAIPIQGCREANWPDPNGIKQTQLKYWTDPTGTSRVGRRHGGSRWNFEARKTAQTVKNFDPITLGHPRVVWGGV